MNPAAHPHRPTEVSPHENVRIAGASPNETTSASESNSRPNAVEVPVIRATRRGAQPKNGSGSSDAAWEFLIGRGSHAQSPRARGRSVFPRRTVRLVEADLFRGVARRSG